MKKIVTYIFLIITGTLSVPYAITMFMTGTHTTVNEVVPYDGRIIISENENYTQTQDYSQYLVGVTARMLIMFDGNNFSENVFNYPEFVKLCCILANTFLTNEFEGNDVITDVFLQNYYITDEDLQKLWGENYTNNINIINNALSETAGQIITYNNLVATPYYHFISNGKTRINTTTSDSFLKTADTYEDLEESGFLAVKTFTHTEFIELLKTNLTDTNPPQATLNSQTPLKEIIQIIDRDDAGYVTGIQIENITMTGDAFAEMFGLNSPSFTITFQGDSIKLITKGIGHGYGISLTYAFRLARAGNTYTDIINYFYNNVEIKNYK